MNSQAKYKKILSLLSLATKAQKIEAGAFLSERAVKRGTAALVIVAEDASANTCRQFEQMCFYYKVPVIRCADKDTLGHAMGKELRSVTAVTDGGFARRILTIYEEECCK